MKHLVVLLVLLFAGYGAWQATAPLTRRHELRLIARHGLRLGAVVLILLALLALAYHLPSAKIL